MEAANELSSVHSKHSEESEQSPDGTTESANEPDTKEASLSNQQSNDECTDSFKQPLIPSNQHQKPEQKMDSSSDNDDISSLLSLSTPKLDYKPPCWASEPNVEDAYGIDVIKNGIIIESIDFKNSKSSNHFVIGRLPLCDMTLDHPTISRYHCILQYGEDLMERSGKGWHVYDLGSTHGTKLNKRRIPSKQYIRIRVGYVMQFGGSSRIMVLKGPSSDAEKECEYSPSEMKKMRERRKLEDKLRKEAENEVKEENDNEGISWGMDYGEEHAYAHADGNDFDEQRESAYSDDPMKALSHFFDREGFDMEFTFTESGMGHTHKWTCYIELPVDTAAGQSLSASGTCSGGKKEAQIMCALNACRTLDMHGVLYGSKSAAKKKAKDLADNDYYDSDEDIYLDRTGQIEKSRESRRKRALEARGEYTEQRETYEGLLKKISSATEEMEQVGKRLQSLSKNVSDVKDNDANDDDLDEFCKNLERTYNKADSIEVKVEKSHLRQKLVELKHEIERMEILAKIAKPVALPALNFGTKASSTPSDPSQQKQSQSAALMQKLMMLRRSKAKESHQQGDGGEVIGMELPPQLSTDKNRDNQFVVETEDDDDMQSVPHVNEPSSTSNNPHSEQPASLSQNQSAATESKSKIISESRPTDSLNVNGQRPKSSIENLSLHSEHSSETGQEKVNRVEDRNETDSGALAETECTSSDQQALERDSKQPLDEGVGESVVRRKRMRLRATDRASHKSTSSTQQSGEYGEGCVNRDLDYATWLPPENQSGDGVTALNAKFAGKY